MSAISKVLSGSFDVGEQITVQGWVRTRRDSKVGFSFIALYDGSCFDTLQIIAPSELENYASDILKLSAGCSVFIEGTLQASPGKGQAYELKATKVTVIGGVEDPEHYPISPKRHTLEYLREHLHLRPRTNLLGAVTRMRHAISQAIHAFFHQEGFYWVHTPILTASDCEGAGELFRVSTLDLMNVPKTEEGAVDFSEDFFGKEAFLTVSGQLNLEAYACALSKVYTFGPTFRAENSNTTRHLAEFWMVEPEIAFADLQDVIALAEGMLKYVVQTVLETREDDLRFCDKWVDDTCLSRLHALQETRFEHMTYTEAVRQLEASQQSFQYPVHWGMDLQTEHERYLTEVLLKKPVAILDYPESIKPFYMRMNDDGKTVAAMDILVPGVGEIMGGSQREERLDCLTERLQAQGLHPEAYDWYLDLRRYGTVPHGGFGLGLERLVSYIMGLANVREAIPFPRTPGHIAD